MYDSSIPEAVLRTLLVSDVVGSTHLVEKLGDRHTAQLFKHHDRLARDLLAEYDGHEIDKTDGFLFLFERPLNAAYYAVAYHEAMAALSTEMGIGVSARVGIHIGEVVLRVNPPEDVARGAKPLEVEGLAKPMAARIMSLALGGQTLLTRGAFDVAHRAAIDTTYPGGEIVWQAHGYYVMKGVSEPIEIFEMGLEATAPLEAPPDSEKVKRFSEPGAPSPGRPPAAVPRRRRFALPAAGIALLALLAVWLVVGRRATLDLETSGPPRVAWLGFAEPTTPIEPWLVPAVRELVALELDAGTDLVAPGEVALAARKLALDDLTAFAGGVAPEVLETFARDHGAHVLAAGEVAWDDADGELELVLRLWSTATGESVELEASGPATGLTKLAERLGARTISALGLEAGHGDAPQEPAALEPTVEQLYRAAAKARRDFDEPTAYDQLAKALEQAPETGRLHLALAEVQADQGRRDEAHEHLRAALGGGGLSHRERIHAWSVYLSLDGAFDGAAALETLLWQQEPAAGAGPEQRFDQGLRLVMLQARAGWSDAAAATLGVLRQLPPPWAESPQLDLGEAEVALYGGDLERHLEVVRRARSRVSPGASPLLRAQVVLKEGYALLLMARLYEACDALETARRLFVHEAHRRGEADTRYLLGNLAERQLELGEARTHYDAAARLYAAIGHTSREARTLSNKALVMEKVGDLEASVGVYEQTWEKLLETGDRVGAAHTLINMMLPLTSLGRFSDARQSHATALGILDEVGHPDLVVLARIHLGQLLMKEGNISEASQTFATVLDQEGTDPFDLNQARLYLGQVSLHQGDLAAAEKHFNESLEFYRATSPVDAAGARRWLADIERERGELGAAREIYREVMELQSAEGAAAWASTARAMAELELADGRAKRAEELAREALAAFEANQRILEQVAGHELLARVLLARGELDTADGELARARELQVAGETLLSLPLELTATRLRAARGDEDVAELRTQLNALLSAATSSGCNALGLEIELAREEIEILLGNPRGGSRLVQLEERARSAGYGRIARRAARLRQGASP